MCALDLGMASYKLWDSSSFKAFQKKNQEDKAKQIISEDDLITLKQVLSRSYQDSNLPVPLSAVVKEVREELPFTCSYRDVAQIALP